MADANFASLSPRLLARKGGARPAMRSQASPLSAAPATASEADLEDLGWNDLGEERGTNPAQPAIRHPVTPPAEIIAIGSARARADDPSIPASPSSGNRTQGARAKPDRAAFTLRLDADRHLKLRLACTVRQCSAQQLVTDALDALLAGMPDIQRLASQVGRN